ncbi:hypothetical protein B0H11DRAFT_437990 [Mycena galericulata]|nr:hypothetical protein B0H11DRAFT_437990 [Mycena galericulata]
MVMSPSPIPGLITFPLRAANFDDGMDVDPLAPSEIQLGAPGESDTPTDTLAIEQLSKTLMDVRKEVASHIIKERAILLALKTFDSTSAPVKELANPALDIPSPENVFIAKIRLQLLKNELQNARSKRVVVEQSVKEIAKEGRAPFICPALMNAFIGVSRLSAEALRAED